MKIDESYIVGLRDRVITSNNNKKKYLIFLGDIKLKVEITHFNYIKNSMLQMLKE
jgi:hypothetical protein